MAVPFPNELRYNFIKGTSNTGIRISGESVSPRRATRIKIENNKVRGMDDYPMSESNIFDA